MTIATFAEASELLGYRSPSMLYKLKKEGQLDDYVMDIDGRAHLVMKSVGKPKSKDYLGSILRSRIDGLINNHY